MENKSNLPNNAIKNAFSTFKSSNFNSIASELLCAEIETQYKLCENESSKAAFFNGLIYGFVTKISPTKYDLNPFDAANKAMLKVAAEEMRFINNKADEAREKGEPVANQNGLVVNDISPPSKNAENYTDAFKFLNSFFHTEPDYKIGELKCELRCAEDLAEFISSIKSGQLVDVWLTGMGWLRAWIRAVSGDSVTVTLVKRSSESLDHSLSCVSAKRYQLRPYMSQTLTGVDSWRKELCKGSKIDLMNPNTGWFFGQVTDVDEKSDLVKVSFYGAENGESDTETHPRTSIYIAPRGTFALNDAGGNFASLAVENICHYDEDDDGVEKFKQRQNSKAFAQYLIYFDSLGGFEQILRGFELYQIKISITDTFLESLNKISAYFSKSFAMQFVKRLSEGLTKMLLAIPERKMKELSNEMLENINFSLIKMLKRVFPTDLTVRILKKFNFHIAVKRVNSNNLERKINGIKYISKECSAAINNTECRVGEEEISLWIIQSNILPNIFENANVHSQIVKRAGSIINLMLGQKPYQKETLDLVWKCISKRMKSKSEFHTVNSLLLSVTNSLEFKPLHNFLSTILRETPLSAFNHPSTLTLIKKCVLNFCQNYDYDIPPLKAKDDDLEFESVCISREIDEKTRQKMSREILEKSVELFWKVCEKKHGESEDGGWKLAFEVFHEMLNVATLFESALIDKYIERAMALLKSGEGIPFVLKMLLIIINVFCRNEESTRGFGEIKQNSKKSGKKLNTVIVGIDSHFDILDTLMDQINKIAQETNDSSFHKIEQCFSFLNYILSNSTLELSNDHIQMLWDQCVVKTSSRDTRLLLFVWLSEGVWKKSDFSRRISEKNAELVFELASNNLPLVCASKEGFFCFKTYLLLTNYIERRLDLLGDGSFEIIDFNFSGTEAVFSILLSCASDEIAALAAKLLNYVYFSCFKFLYSDNEQIPPEMGSKACRLNKLIAFFEEYVNQIMSLLAMRLSANQTVGGLENSEREISRLVFLLCDFVRLFDRWSGTENMDSHYFSGGKNENFGLKVSLQTKNDKMSLVIEMNEKSTVLELKEKIIENVTDPDFKYSAEDLKMFCNGKDISINCDDKTLGFLRMKEIGSIIATFRKSKRYPNLAINSETTKRVENALHQIYAKVGGERGELTMAKLAELVEEKMGEPLCSGLSSDEEFKDNGMPKDRFVKTVTREICYGEKPMKNFLCSFGFKFGSKMANTFLPTAKEEIRRVLPHLILASKPENYDTLFETMKVIMDTKTEMKIWDLLMKIPTDRKRVRSFKTKACWENMFKGDTASPFGTFEHLYQLQILEKLTSSDAALGASFLQNGGFKRVYEILAEAPNNGLNGESETNKNCLYYIVKLLTNALLSFLFKTNRLRKADFRTSEKSAEEMDTESDKTSSSEEVIEKIKKKSSALYRKIDESAANGILTTVVFDRLLFTLIDTMGVCAARENFNEMIDLKIEKEIIKLINCLIVKKHFLFAYIFAYFSAEKDRFFKIVLSENKKLRAAFIKHIELICIKASEKYKDKSPLEKFMFFLLTNLETVSEPSSECFQILKSFIEKSETVVMMKPNKILNHLLTILEFYKSKETIDNLLEADHDLHLLLKSLEAALECVNFKVKDKAMAKRIIDCLMGDCLFTISDDYLLPKCKAKETRVIALTILHRITMKDNLCLMANAFSSLLVGYGGKGYESSIKVYKYSGLSNLGSTCYMNSLLQQFFVMPEFREVILNIDTRGTDSQSDDILVQTQKLFCRLWYTIRPSCDTKNFCRSYKDIDGNPINVGMQQDAQEFFNIFTDNIENKLKTTAHKDLLKRVFGGVLENQMICLGGCRSIRTRKEDFYNITIEVKGKRSLEESLDAYVEKELLNGVHCEKCGRNCDTEKRVVFHKLAGTMIFHLKRFELNYESFQHEKLNSKFTFPLLLNLEKFTKSGIENAENGFAGKGRSAEAENGAAPLGEEYVLMGIVVHSGSAFSGHYFSYIRDRDDLEKWMEFNDSSITPFDISEIEESCFGGEVKDSLSSGLYNSNPEIVQNAYMLVYDRVSTLKREPEGASAAQLDFAASERKAIVRENKVFLMDVFVFDEKFQRFFFLTLEKLVKTEKAVSEFKEGDLLRFVKVAFNFIFNIAKNGVSSNEREVLESILNLQKLLKSNFSLGKHFLKHISAIDNAVYTIFVKMASSLSSDISRVLINLICCVCLEAVTAEQKVLSGGEAGDIFPRGEDGPEMEDLFGELLDAIVKAIEKTVGTNNSIENLAQFINKFVKFSPNAMEFLLRKDLITALGNYCISSDEHYNAGYHYGGSTNMNRLSQNVKLCLKLIDRLLKGCQSPKPPSAPAFSLENEDEHEEGQGLHALSQNDRKILYNKKLYLACLDKNCSNELTNIIKVCSKRNWQFSTSFIEILNDLLDTTDLNSFYTVVNMAIEFGKINEGKKELRAEMLCKTRILPKIISVKKLNEQCFVCCVNDLVKAMREAPEIAQAMVRRQSKAVFEIKEMIFASLKRNENSQNGKSLEIEENHRFLNALLKSPAAAPSDAAEGSSNGDEAERKAKPAEAKRRSMGDDADGEADSPRENESNGSKKCKLLTQEKEQR